MTSNSIFDSFATYSSAFLRRGHFSPRSSSGQSQLPAGSRVPKTEPAFISHLPSSCWAARGEPGGLELLGCTRRSWELAGALGRALRTPLPFPFLVRFRSKSLSFGF
uniref:Uncharacterized protein n=1 Tax=Amazona collaria TaxID=241587 RepID=A0A8B9GGJ5_9PSIT